MNALRAVDRVNTGERGGPLAARPGPDDIVESVRALSLALERWRVMFARRYGLADNDAVVMSHLASAEGRLLPRDLSRIMDLRTGTLTAMLDRLEAVDFVRRVPNPDDRRSTFVELTERGSAALAESFGVLRRRIQTGIPERTQEQFARHLSDLARIVDTAVDEIATQLKPPRAPRARPRSS
jgi:DNA-binding MarR family transcriptional regulator